MAVFRLESGDHQPENGFVSSETTSTGLLSRIDGSVLPFLGGFGKYQKQLVVLTCIPVLFIGFSQFSDNFLLAQPNSTCVHPIKKVGNTTASSNSGTTAPYLHANSTGNESTSIDCSCLEWDYTLQTGLVKNVVTKWNLVCKSEWMVHIAKFSLLVGSIFGYLVLGVLADWFGRRPVLITSVLFMVVFGLAVAFSINVPMFSTLRFFEGFCLAGITLSLYVLRIELCLPLWRFRITMVANFVVLAGQLLMPGLAALCRDWQILQAIIICPFILMLSYFWIFPESLRWLLSTLQYCRARRQMHRIARRNKVGGTDTDELFSELQNESQKKPKKTCIVKMVGTRNLWKNIVVLCVNSLTGYGIHHCFARSMIDPEAGETIMFHNFYADYYTMAGIAVASCLALCPAVGFMGRRGGLLMFMIITALASLLQLGLLTLLWKYSVQLNIGQSETLNKKFSTAFSIIGMFSSHAVSNLSIFFCAEITPTVIRGGGLGLVLASAGFGRLTAPIMELHNQKGYFLHHVIFACCTLICIICILLLPETRYKPLPEHIGDGEAFVRPPLLAPKKAREQDPLLNQPDPAQRPPVQETDLHGADEPLSVEEVSTCIVGALPPGAGQSLAPCVIEVTPIRSTGALPPCEVDTVCPVVLDNAHAEITDVNPPNAKDNTPSSTTEITPPSPPSSTEITPPSSPCTRDTTPPYITDTTPPCITDTTPPLPPCAADAAPPCTTEATSPSDTDPKSPSATAPKSPSATAPKSPSATAPKSPSATAPKSFSATDLKSPSATDPKSPSTTDLKSPSSTDPKSPSDTAPKSPSATDPKSPSDIDPKSPSDIDPKSPSATAPKSPSATAPKSPSDTDPKSPSATAPKSPSATDLKSPSATDPKSPSAVDPKSPSATAPKSPSTTDPKSPSDTAPKSPSATAPKSPSATAPKSPSATAPKSPSDTDPKSPSATAPKSPSATDPKSPSATAPKSPSATAPKSPSDTDLKSPSATDPKSPSAVDPKSPSATDPKSPSATDPKSPSDTAPKSPSATAPKSPSATAPKSPSATAPKSPSDTDPKSPSATAPKSPTDIDPKSPSATAPKSPSATAPKSPSDITLDPKSPSATDHKSPSTTDLKSPSATAPKSPSATAPKSPSATDPKSPSATAPKSPSATAPKSPSDITLDPKSPSATDHKSPSATAPKSPSDTDPKSPSATAPKSPSDTDPKSPSATAPKSPSATAPKSPSDITLDPKSPSATAPKSPRDIDPKSPSSTAHKSPSATAPKSPSATDAVLLGAMDSASCVIDSVHCSPTDTAASWEVKPEPPLDPTTLPENSPGPAPSSSTEATIPQNGSANGVRSS